MSLSPTDPGLPLYRLDLQYIGTPFLGWQSQPAGNTVQDHLEKALTVMLRHPVRITGASRTDTGVHAEQQVATFRTAVPFASHLWLKSLNALLPPEIGIAHISLAPPEFHPILSAHAKVYRYRVWRSPSRNPFAAPLAWTLPPTLDLPAMRRAASDMIGRHDFTSFCAVDSSAKTRTRHLIDLDILESGPLLEFWFLGAGFLKQMVRTLVGTLIDIGRSKYPPTCIPALLSALDRRSAGQTAPALGLTLVHIFYDLPPPPLPLSLALLRSSPPSLLSTKLSP